MPIHDWTKVFPGLFHHFHQDWLIAINRLLNDALLPSDHYAIAEQVSADDSDGTTFENSELASEALTLVFGSEHGRLKDRIAIKSEKNDQTVAVVEIVSLANKKNAAALRTFLRRTLGLFAEGIHSLVLDLHPPGPHDPAGIHTAVWGELGNASATFPSGKPLILASYRCGVAVEAFVDPVAVGDALPDMPLFLSTTSCVSVPLEKTYMIAWEGVPRRWQKVIDPCTS